MGYGDSIVPTGLLEVERVGRAGRGVGSRRRVLQRDQAAEVYCELLPTPKAAPERAVILAFRRFPLDF